MTLAGRGRKQGLQDRDGAPALVNRLNGRLRSRQGVTEGINVRYLSPEEAQYLTKLAEN